MFHPLSGHLQAIKVHKDKSSIASYYLYGSNEISFLTSTHQYKMLKPITYISNLIGKQCLH